MLPSTGQSLDGMSESSIAKGLDAVRVRISQFDCQREELERKLALAREEERLLMRLLALRQGLALDADDDALPVEDQKCLAEKLPAPPETEAGSNLPMVQAVVRELAGAGRPLHISELMRLLRERRVQIPGAGTQANLISHLRRDPRLVRPSRGMYGLSAWGLENMPTMTNQKRRRKRVRSKAPKGRRDK
jgi:hypothetical protein